MEDYRQLVQEFEELHKRKAYLLQVISDHTVEDPASYGKLANEDHRMHDCQG